MTICLDSLFLIIKHLTANQQATEQLLKALLHGAFEVEEVLAYLGEIIVRFVFCCNMIYETPSRKFQKTEFIVSLLYVTDW